MQEPSITIRNEFGNEIKIHAKQQDRRTAILTIEGPSSISTNELTMMEICAAQSVLSRLISDWAATVAAPSGQEGK